MANTDIRWYTDGVALSYAAYKVSIEKNEAHEETAYVLSDLIWNANKLAEVAKKELEVLNGN